MKTMVCLFGGLLLSIIVGAAGKSPPEWLEGRPPMPPPEWTDSIRLHNILYTEDEQSVAYMPLLANGYLSQAIGGDSVYVGGLFNGGGTGSVSHRARLPASLSVTVEPGPNATLEPMGAGLDLVNGTYTRLARVSEGGSYVDIEQAWFAHRVFRSVLAMRLTLTYVPGANPHPVTLLLNTTAGNLPTEDVDLRDVSDDHPGRKVLHGHTRAAEVEDGPLIEVAVVSTPVPPSVTVTANTTLDLIMSARTSLDPPAKYGPVLQAALNDHGMAASMAPSGELYLVHLVAWRGLWASGFEVRGRDDVAMAVNASMFSLLSSVRPDWPHGLSPGGLTNGYNGHSFWDTETWMLPPLLLWYPDVARSLLQYRFDRLDAAMAKAASHDPPYSGAMFPWESASTGSEVCPPSLPMGLREQHISGDVALAAYQYWQATDDLDWLRTRGYPLLKAVADFWASRAVMDEGGAAHIRDVMPPDEYADHVDDSVYTNVLAGLALRFAEEAAEALGEESAAEWRVVREALVVLFDEESGLHPEYQGYNGQTIKQADVVLLGYPLGYPGLTAAVRERELEYYGERTDRQGPAMTWGMHAIGYLDLGKEAQAAALFNRSFHDYVQQPFGVWSETAGGGGTPHFITGASGFLQTLLFGYMGLRLEAGALQVNPVCLEGAELVRARGLHYRGTTFDLEYNCSSSSISSGQARMMRIKPTRRRPGAEPLVLHGPGAGGEAVRLLLPMGRAVELPLAKARLVQQGTTAGGRRV